MANAQYSIAVDLGATKVVFALMAISGRIVAKSEQVTRGKSFDAISKQITNGCRNYLDEKDVRAITVAVPGIINNLNGKLIYAVNFNWRGMSLKEALEKRLKCPVIVDNDVKVAALGEYYFGNKTGSKSVFVVNVGTGIGGALIKDGQVLRGHSNIAGEIGHISVDYTGPRCRCGNYGCLDLYASGRAIEHKSSLLRKSERNRGQKSNIEWLCMQANKRYPSALHIFEEAGTSLGVGVISVINLLNPESIILRGGVLVSWDYLKHSFFKVIRTRAFSISRNSTNIALTSLGDDAPLLGGVVLTKTSL